MDNIRIGSGYDIHKFLEISLFDKADKRLYLGGVLIEGHIGVAAHSDGDVVLHSLTDALLGALSLPDIGVLYPDNLKSTKGISSIEIIKYAYKLVLEKGYKLVNADITIITQTPKISAYKEKMIESVSAVLEVDKSRINIKGKTKEGLDSVGKQKAIECFSVCLLSSLQ
ncbi:MAG: 2-C-methyl-D-erythritol 2,4-cyclodiphosphate synthase [bacterium]